MEQFGALLLAVFISVVMVTVLKKIFTRKN